MQKRKNSKLKKFLFATLLLLLSISVPFQVNAKTDQQIQHPVAGHLNVNVGDTKTYVISSSSNAGSAYYYTMKGNKTYTYQYKVDTGTKFTIKVANLTANPYQDLGMTGFYNITITKKDNTNISTVIISAGYDYVPFLMWGFDNRSEADNFTQSYDNYTWNHPLIDEFQAQILNNKDEILFMYESGNGSYIRFEYNYINWKTGWLDKCLLQTKTVGSLNVVKEVVIQPLGSSSANGMEAISVLILGIPAILILERRKKK